MCLKRFFLLLAVLLSPALLVRAQNGLMGTNTAFPRTAILARPSIIFIACHGLGLGDLSCYGQTNFLTPNFDRLAAEGMRFTNYRVPGDGLAVAQGALLAGNTEPFSSREMTVAMRLKLASYYTGLLGEWVLSPEPVMQGFDDFNGFLSEDEARNYYCPSIWHLLPRMSDSGTNRLPGERLIQEEIHNNAGGQKGWYMPDGLMEAMSNFAKINQPDIANRFRPFFLLLDLPAPESVTPGQDEYPVPTDAPFTGEAWPQAAKNRAALITRLDTDIGRLFEQLQKIGLTNNVAIFLTGAAAPEAFADTNLDFLKVPGEVRGGTSEDHLRVPMIVRWPGHVPGRVSDAPWGPQDFAATASQMAYGRQPNFTGTSMFRVLMGLPAANKAAQSETTGQKIRPYGVFSN